MSNSATPTDTWVAWFDAHAGFAAWLQAGGSIIASMLAATAVIVSLVTVRWVIRESRTREKSDRTAEKVSALKQMRARHIAITAAGATITSTMQVWHEIARDEDQMATFRFASTPDLVARALEQAIEGFEKLPLNQIGDVDGYDSAHLLVSTGGNFCTYLRLRADKKYEDDGSLHEKVLKNMMETKAVAFGAFDSMQKSLIYLQSEAEAEIYGRSPPIRPDTKPIRPLSEGELKILDYLSNEGWRDIRNPPSE